MQPTNKVRRDSTIHESWAILICMSHELSRYTYAKEKYAVKERRHSGIHVSWAR